MTSNNAVKDDAYSNGVYTLYKDNGYIIASVVVGEDAAASKNLVYVHSSDVEQEGYDKTADEWTWTRKVISDGQEIELTEVGDSLTYLDSMDRYSWYQVKFNADNEVISVEKASDAVLGANEYVDNIKELQAAIDAEDTVLYTQSFKNDQPTMRGSTLYVISTTDDDNGFFVAEDVNIALIEIVKNKQEVTFETGVDELEDIIDDLNEKNDKFDYQISAILEDGAATSVVIYDKTNTYERPEDETPAGLPSVSVSTKDMTVTVPVIYGKDTDVSELAIAALENAGYTVEGVRLTDGGEYTLTASKGRVSGYVFTTDTVEYAEREVKLAGAWAEFKDSSIKADKQYVAAGNEVSLTITYGGGEWTDTEVRTGTATASGCTLADDGSTVTSDGTPTKNSDEFTGLKIGTIEAEKAVVTVTI